MLVTISAVGNDGLHKCYIIENVTRLFLSKKAYGDLGIIGKNFPAVGSADNVHTVNKCELVDMDTSNSKPTSCLSP